MTREEALIIARHMAAGAQAMHGNSFLYCQMTRDGRCDDTAEVQAAHAALLLSEPHRQGLLDDIRAKTAEVVGIAA